MASKTDSKLTAAQREELGFQVDVVAFERTGTRGWGHATSDASRSDLRADGAGLSEIDSGIVSFWATPDLYPAAAQ